jgi:hypothetical protein
MKGDVELGNMFDEIKRLKEVNADLLKRTSALTAINTIAATAVL